ncbi:MAG: YdcF family protein [Armatimonadota bacterium]|nr:YdcF family protein [Armatimonadota bacterium]
MVRWLALAAAVLLAAGGVFRDAALQAVGDFLVVNDPLEQADAVIAISGNGPERLTTAVALLRDGFARVLIISGGPYVLGRRPRNSAEVMRDEVLAAGVPAAQVLMDDRATSTYDNAVGAAALMRTHGLRTAFLVTSPYHTRRAAVIFRRVFHADGLRVRVRASEESFFDVRRWWERPRDRRLVYREYLKLLAATGGAR